MLVASCVTAVTAAFFLAPAVRSHPVTWPDDRHGAIVLIPSLAADHNAFLRRCIGEPGKSAPWLASGHRIRRCAALASRRSREYPGEGRKVMRGSGLMFLTGHFARSARLSRGKRAVRSQCNPVRSRRVHLARATVADPLLRRVTDHSAAVVQIASSQPRGVKVKNRWEESRIDDGVLLVLRHKVWRPVAVQDPAGIRTPDESFLPPRPHIQGQHQRISIDNS